MSLSMFIFLFIMTVGLGLTILLYLATVVGIYRGWRSGEKMVAKIMGDDLERMPAKQLLKKALIESFSL